MWWPKLDSDIAQHVASSTTGKAAHRSEREMLEEVLLLARSIDVKTAPKMVEGVSPSALKDLIMCAVELAGAALACAPVAETLGLVSLLRASVEWIVGRSGLGPSARAGFQPMLNRLALLEASGTDISSRLEVIGMTPMPEESEPGKPEGSFYGRLRLLTENLREERAKYETHPSDRS
jgi:hypothetical protein